MTDTKTVLAVTTIDSPASHEFFDAESAAEYGAFMKKARERRCNTTPRVRLDLDIVLDKDGAVDCPGLRRYFKYFPVIAKEFLHRMQVALI